MIFVASVRGNAPQLARYLLATGENERVALLELRGCGNASLPEAFADLEALATGTRCDRHLYHLTLNTRAAERLTPDQRARALDRLEAELGFAGQPRAVVLHEKKGREHLHIVWSRIDVDRMRAISDSFNYRRHEQVARELEREFGHARVQGVHIERDGVERPERDLSRAAKAQAARTGLTRDDARALLTPLWVQADTGQAFAAALDEAGWVLAQGDRRDFVVVDPAGAVHSLARCVEGVRAKDVRARLADLDRAQLPTLAEARARQRAAVPGVAQAPAAAELADPEPRLAGPSQETRNMASPYDSGAAEWQKTAEAERLAQLYADEQTFVRLQRRDEARRAFFAEKTREAEVARQRLAEQDAARRRTQDDQDEAARKAKQEQEAAARQVNGDVADGWTRYAQALGEHYNVLRPYETLARAAVAEYGAFAREQEALKRQAAAERDPQARQLLEMRREIEALDYMAITSERLARISRVTTGDLRTVADARRDAIQDAELGIAHVMKPTRSQAEIDQQRAVAYRAQAAALRADRSALTEKQAFRYAKDPDFRAATRPDLAHHQTAAAPAPGGETLTSRPTPARPADRRADDNATRQEQVRQQHNAAHQPRTADRPAAAQDTASAVNAMSPEEQRQAEARARKKVEALRQQRAAEQHLTQRRGQSR